MVISCILAVMQPNARLSGPSFRSAVSMDTDSNTDSTTSSNTYSKFGTDPGAKLASISTVLAPRRPLDCLSVPPFAHPGRYTGQYAPPYISHGTPESCAGDGTDFRGEWIGVFRGHFPQTIRVFQYGDLVIGYKITGDAHVPGEEVSFWFRYKSGQHSYYGGGQVAEAEHRNSCFVHGSAEITTSLGPEIGTFVFHWSNCGKVEFRYDGPVTVEEAPRSVPYHK